MSVIESIPVKKFEFIENDELKLRLSIGLTLFLPRPFELVREGVFDLWNKYLDIVGNNSLTWARLGGGNRSRVFSPAVSKTIESWLNGSKSYGQHCWISAHDGPFDCLGTTGFLLEGYGEAKENDEDVGFLEVYFPLSLLDQIEPCKLAETLVNLTSKIPFLCGVAGYFFHHSPYATNDTMRQMSVLSERFSGVEISVNQRMCYWAGHGLTTINWITFVGEEYLARLGGLNVLKPKIPNSAVLWVLEHGVAIQAGNKPTVGDRNRQSNELIPLKEVYNLLKPIQFVDVDYSFSPSEFDSEKTVRWLTRFDLL